MDVFDMLDDELNDESKELECALDISEKPVDFSSDEMGEYLDIYHMAKELETEEQRYGRNKETVINASYINSGEYRAKFDKITDNIELARALYQVSKEMLLHRNGTKFEDMYWLDSKGNIVTKCIDCPEEKGIKYTTTIYNHIKNRTDLITLHTHPDSLPPSPDDFRKNFSWHYDRSFVICHNGDIYEYKAYSEISVFLESDLRIEMKRIAENRSYDERDAMYMALKNLEKEYNIYVQEVRKT